MLSEACWALTQLFILLFVFQRIPTISTVTEPASASANTSCHVAQFNCYGRSGCQSALKTFFLHCQTVIKGEEQEQCPLNCRHALVSLLSTEDQAGLAFINCNCHRRDLCEERKRRVEICKRQVLASMDVLQDATRPVTCNLARWLCEADTSCQTALLFYFQHCSRLFSGHRCTSRCRNSVEILSRQTHAQKLRTCKCDGSEDFDCDAVKINTEKFCLRRGWRRHAKSRSRSKTLGHARRRARRRKRRNRPQKAALVRRRKKKMTRREGSQAQHRRRGHRKKRARIKSRLRWSNSRA